VETFGTVLFFQQPPFVRQFKMLLLTVCEAEDKPPYLQLNLKQENMVSLLDSWLYSGDDSTLDGVYLQYEDQMLDNAGTWRRFEWGCFLCFLVVVVVCLD
jgi:hypothetical protein